MKSCIARHWPQRDFGMIVQVEAEPIIPLIQQMTTDIPDCEPEIA
jgi:hypothetical protein